jgi:pimeloyl-ACP methyl ester carboxylesterase
VGQASGFRSVEAGAAYCRPYDEALAASAVPVEECDVETSYGVTHVLRAGDPADPPLVALHAKSFSSTMWLPLLPALVDGHYVNLIDAMGDVNKSVATQVLSSPRRVASWLEETTTALQIRRASIVAASVGTWMAVHYAMEHPERVDRLALICPAGIVSRQHAR